MEKKALLTWLTGIFAIGILCIFALGRPSPSQSLPVSASYTKPPYVTAAPSGAALAAQLSSVVSSAQPVVAPTATQPPPTVAPAATVITTAPGPSFVPQSVLNLPLKEAVAKVAVDVPGAVVRPIPQGRTAPPGTYDPKRVSLVYDPNTLAVTQAVVG